MSSSEESAIDALVKEKLCVARIAKNIGRSRTVVYNYLKRKESGAEQKKGGRPSILSPRIVSALAASARKPGMTARKVKDETGVRASLRTVQRTLSTHEHLAFGHLKPRPALTPIHVSRRFEWAKKMSFVGPSKWRRTIFTDEKRFCLDGPDGTAHNWRDTRLPRTCFSKRQKGGGGIMVWGRIGWRGKTPLVFVTNKVNAVEYVRVLEEVYEPFIESLYPKGAILQQDNAPAHTALYTKDYFAEAGIVDLPWAPRSPDMNIIENCWGVLSRAVYDGGRQFDTIDDLKECLIYEWEKLSLEYIRNLVESMPRRVRELYVKRGRETKY